MKLSDYSWVRESLRGEIKRKDDRCIKIIALNTVGIICYQLPETVNIEELELVAGQQNEVLLTDRRDFRMDLTDRAGAIRSGRAS
ncbi:MAG: hypothetical protein QF803_02060 [Gammaproteobacteria bacterium]|nr:hypothetical protein [Gammaproteobacteria bacterium]MDP6694381.1 hypothetical protein [Gammaproteobacteria bacterium]